MLVCACLCVCVRVCEEVKHEISGTATGTKFAPAYASIFMDERETDFLNTQEFKLLVCSLFGHRVKKNWTSS